MKKILVPVDFSEHTEISCKYALEIAKKFNSEIRLFYSYFDQIIVTDSSFPTSVDTGTMLNEQLMRDIEVIAKNDIREIQTKISNEIHKEHIKEVKVTYTIVPGEAEFEIQEICDEYKPDLIIMGSSGKGKKDIFSGSVSRKIMNRANVPVLAIPPIPEYQEIKNVMYSTEFNDLDIEKINKLFKIFNDFNINVTCVHFNFDGKKTDPEQKINKLKEIFKDKIEADRLSFKIIECENLKDDLSNFVEKNSIDLIAFISHKTGFFSRLFKQQKITKADLFKANIPLFAMHE
ncbi:MAG: universal stress protein [Bacteroidales bacterium]|nr:universal stress protein [Bacteroidales bacterium]